ncbi:hypothetical protein [Salinibacter ruber]|uniref:hypothetical protein n=1 Tax=Salinibacter ruber TaxID=146919 RepID=UPI00216AA1FB|nr:hypothetical protein [Salinibacter ruber]MCS4051410.1 hypothetical protein [Salinibacter ruber]
MSKNTVFDEWHGEIYYHDTFALDGKKIRIVDYEKIPNRSPVENGCRFVFYSPKSQYVWCGDNKELGVKKCRDIVRKLDDWPKGVVRYFMDRWE